MSNSTSLIETVCTEPLATTRRRVPEVVSGDGCRPLVLDAHSHPLSSRVQVILIRLCSTCYSICSRFILFAAFFISQRTKIPQVMGDLNLKGCFGRSCAPCDDVANSIQQKSGDRSRHARKHRASRQCGCTCAFGGSLVA